MTTGTLGRAKLQSNHIPIYQQAGCLLAAQPLKAKSTNHNNQNISSNVIDLKLCWTNHCAEAYWRRSYVQLPQLSATESVVLFVLPSSHLHLKYTQCHWVWLAQLLCCFGTKRHSVLHYSGTSATNIPISNVRQILALLPSPATAAAAADATLSFYWTNPLFCSHSQSSQVTSGHCLGRILYRFAGCPFHQLTSSVA